MRRLLEKHGDAGVSHVAADRFPWLGDREHFSLSQRNMDAALQLGQTAVVVGIRAALSSDISASFSCSASSVSLSHLVAGSSAEFRPERQHVHWRDAARRLAHDDDATVDDSIRRHCRNAEYTLSTKISLSVTMFSSCSCGSQHILSKLFTVHNYDHSVVTTFIPRHVSCFGRLNTIFCNTCKIKVLNISLMSWGKNKKTHQAISIKYWQ